MVKRKMVKNTERRYISKVTEGFRVRIPQEIVDKYRMGKTDVVEWTIDKDGKINVEIKEIVLRGKNPNIEKVMEKDVAKGKKAKVEKVKERKDMYVGNGQ